MSEATDKNSDDHIAEAKQHLDQARELKPEGPATQIRALAKAQESVGHAIDAIVNESNRKTQADLVFEDLVFDGLVFEDKDVIDGHFFRRN